MVIKVGDKWCKATTTWKFWWNFLAKSLFFSRYPSFSPFERPDAYKCYIFSESYGSRETREIKISTSKFDLEARGILSSLWTQTGPWSDTASYCISGYDQKMKKCDKIVFDLLFCVNCINTGWRSCLHCRVSKRVSKLLEVMLTHMVGSCLHTFGILSTLVNSCLVFILCGGSLQN